MSLVSFIKTIKMAGGNSDDVLKIMERVVAGADGIPGTEDDIMSPEFIALLKNLLSHKDFIKELVDELKVIEKKKSSCFCFN